MTFTVSLGWWLLPLIITIATIAYAWITTAQDRIPRGDYSFTGIGTAFAMGGAAIVSLVSWLVRALLR